MSLLNFCLGKRGAVIRDLSVQHANDAGGIALGKLRVMRDHDHQTILGNLLQDIHDLHAGFGIQSARGLICQNNIGIVDQRTRDGNPLHLSAGHFGRAFMKLVSEPDFLQSVFCTLSPL